MKVPQIVILAVLVFLAVSSGVTKIMLMPQDVMFFGDYGFTNPLLVIFGAVQVIGGLMMMFVRTRVICANAVAITFVISVVVLVLAGSVGPTIATLLALVFLGLTIRRTLAEQRAGS